jgi:hypothetical protein
VLRFLSGLGQSRAGGNPPCLVFSQFLSVLLCRRFAAQTFHFLKKMECLKQQGGFAGDSRLRGNDSGCCTVCAKLHPFAGMTAVVAPFVQNCTPSRHLQSECQIKQEEYEICQSFV